MDFKEKLFSQLQRTTLIDQVVDQCDVVVMATDLHGEVLMADGGMLREMGIKPCDLVGTSIQDAAFSPSKWSEGLKAVTNGRKRVSFLVGDAGSVVLETFGPMLSPAGRVVGVLAIAAVVSLES